MMCQMCGSELEEGASVCPKCEESKNLDIKEKNTAKISIAMYILFLYVLPLIGLYFYSFFERVIDIDSFFNLVAETSLMVLLVVLILKNLPKEKEDRPKFNLKTVGMGALFWVIMQATIYIIYMIIYQFVEPTTSANQEAVVEGIRQLWLLSSLTAVVAAPIIEEIIFRKNLKTFIKNDALFVIISALIFGGVHSLDIINHMNYYIMGAFFALAYVKTRNIYVPIIAHAIQNTIATILVLMTIF